MSFSSSKSLLFIHLFIVVSLHITFQALCINCLLKKSKHIDQPLSSDPRSQLLWIPCLPSPGLCSLGSSFPYFLRVCICKYIHILSSKNNLYTHTYTHTHFPSFIITYILEKLVSLFLFSPLKFRIVQIPSIAQ